MSERAVAVIVPTLDEAERVAGLVGALRASFAEIVVVDGGSRDGTPDLAAAAGARVLSAPRGRAAQMNAGARAASAPILLFLHADTRLPPDAADLIRHTLAAPGVAGGCFRLGFDEPHPLLALYGWCSRVDSYWTTFGDHAFFMAREAFERAGGYPDWPLLEDVAMRRRLRALGRFVKRPETAVTSARRFRAEGLIRRQLKNALILALHGLGVPASRLVRFYR